MLTPIDLKAKLAVAGYDAKSPTYIYPPQSSAIGDAVATHLPTAAATGEHPRLVIGKSEIAAFNAAIDASEDGKNAKSTLLGIAETALKGDLGFPDPKGPPAQLKDRNDAAAKAHDRLALTCGNLGLAYAITGDERFAQRAAEILKGYASRYSQYAEHKGVNPQDSGKVMAQRLSEAMWIIPLIEGFDYVYSSSALTEEDRAAIGNDLIRTAVAFIRNKPTEKEVADRDAKSPTWRTDMPAPGNGKPQGNWLLFYNTATMMAGSTLNDQNLLDLATADFKRLIRQGIGSDGMWGEGAIGYQFFAMNAMISGLESAARQGIDLYSFDNNRVKQLFDSPLRFAYPDGTAPGINDSGRVKFGSWTTMCYDYALLRYGDPAYALIVNSTPRQLHMSTSVYFPTAVFNKPQEPKATQYPSSIFDNLGYGVMRSPTAYTLLKYGQHGGVHGHYDKLNLLLFAQGDNGQSDEIGGEPVFHKYEDSLHNEWTTQTIAHNTMTVNGRSQVSGEGRLLIFQDTPEVKVMRAESVDASPGSLIDRTIVRTPDLILDLFIGRSNTSKTWDRTFRYQGTLENFPSSPANGSEKLGSQNGYQHINVVATAAADQTWAATWQTKIGKFNLTLAGQNGQKVSIGTGPDKEQVAIARQAGTSGAFLAAYQMGAWGNEVKTVQAVAIDAADTQGYVVTQADGSETLIVVGNGANWTSSGWSSDARVLYVQKAKNRTRLLLCGGTFAKGPGGSVTLEKAANAFAEGENGNLQVRQQP